ncbi:MAG: vanadium-dependent haloperoxidase, partial [Gemmatimonadaceae bacterium]|nr:vanadium-dependent haloperoxidase [Gemmatimonadaceae bacterium]
MMRGARWIAVLALVGCSARPAPVPVSPAIHAERLHAAGQALTDVITYDIFSPPQASRIYAYASVAAWEIVRQADSTTRSLAGQLRDFAPVPAAPRGDSVSLPLAAVHAFLTVGHALTFSRERMDSLRTAAGAPYRAELDAAVYARSIAYGDTVAQRILAWVGQDKYRESRGYPKFSVTQTPGRWTPTPPAYMDAVEPNWAMLRPLVMDSASQFRPPPPPPFSVAAGTPFARELREVYEVGKSLTAEQRAIAAFWDCNPYVMHVQGHTMFATKKMSPGGHWMGIARLAARQRGDDVVRASEAYVRTAIALYEGFLSAWEEKYRSALIRPETAINTHIDEAWQPLLQTPPFPEYPSGHSVISNAASVVLSELYGAQFAYTDSTEQLYGLPSRRFASFRDAAAEASISRL